MISKILKIMPSNRAKAVFDTAKTSSYHISSISQCKQSTKMTSVFKFVLNGRAGDKRYDFEAESPKHAGTWCLVEVFHAWLMTVVH
jgi:hypothetical protein